MGKVVAPVKGWHKLAVQLGISRGKNFAHINKKKPSLFKHCKEARLVLINTTKIGLILQIRKHESRNILL